MKKLELFDYFNLGTEMEEKFLELSHLYELDIKFDFIEFNYRNKLFYFYKDICYFIHSISDNFFINYDVWEPIKSEFRLSDNQIKSFMLSLSNKYFNTNKKTLIYTAEKDFTENLEKTFNI